MSRREEILQQAMQLAPQDRAYVADALEQSISATDFVTPELAEAWANEIQRRIQAHDRGELPAADMETAMRRIRRSPASYRASELPPSPGGA